ncbi:hypothetical protein, partial [Pseudacidovorax intermedius]|uniref:hypothetical protein n=1 Tax=Pseudacidovorax intermedius TaxID=433924 RepID=UPI0019D3F900
MDPALTQCAGVVLTLLFSFISMLVVVGKGRPRLWITPFSRGRPWFWRRATDVGNPAPLLSPPDEQLERIRPD